MKLNRLLPIALFAILTLEGCKTFPEEGGTLALICGCPTEAQVAANYQEEYFFEEEKPKGLGSLELGELENMGTADYMDRMYDGMRRDFEDEGAKFEEIANGLKALGISLVKDKNEYGETRAIEVKIDGDMSFATGSARLTKKAQEMAGHIAEAMLAYPETEATVGGHTDSVGSKQVNRRLSLRRATAVKDFMVTNNKVPAKRILWVKGFADDQKLVQTMGPEPLNRRVEIKLTPAYVPESDLEKEKERKEGAAQE